MQEEMTPYGYKWKIRLQQPYWKGGGRNWIKGGRWSDWHAIRRKVQVTPSVELPPFKLIVIPSHFELILILAPVFESFLIASPIFELILIARPNIWINCNFPRQFFELVVAVWFNYDITHNIWIDCYCHRIELLTFACVNWFNNRNFSSLIRINCSPHLN